MAKMAEHGGYRAPANPAPVSGPGALSARTDGVPNGQVSGLAYGENGALNAQAASAPMAQAPAGPQITPLDAPSQFSDEPVTAGSPLGPGPGPEVLSGRPTKITDLLARLLGDDINGDLEELYLTAESQGL